ncbi:MAG TPA: 5-nitroimidazole antibiotic resistance protein [Lachnospiraceae bacterium]|uniref:pyridoxamine 5'-phosphate oxidase family protein n=1 Tax=Anaerosporobacter sp. TaxID=1872529 RepID=UPI000EEBFA69|nr:pyridoxamine 5'-phosphate oxidase family protein [Anaerosporobacter sp.]HAB60913.1 5-nitroimidazole antibiotic resistance protein [Lachnospiraceae bacterium]
MFREMRRKKQVLSLEENIQVLNRGTSGVLAVSGDDNYPYAVPLSYVYHDNKIFFHCAKKGHKLDAIFRNEKVSFCVIDKDEVIQDEYTSYFRSVIVFGKARILEDDSEKRKAIEILTARYSPDIEKIHQMHAIDKEYNILCMIELTIDHMSGKEAMELVKRRTSK